MHDLSLTAKNFEVPVEFHHDLLKIGWLRYRPAGAILISEGQQSDAAFFLTDGEVRMSRLKSPSRNAFALALGPGSLLCLLAAMSRAGSPVTLETAVASHITLMPASRVRELMVLRPGFCFEVTKILSHELRAFHHGIIAVPR
jgi:CRP-like cAMP-binding protein